MKTSFWISTTDSRQLRKSAVRIAFMLCAVLVHAALTLAVRAQDQLAPANDNLAAAQVLNTAATSVNGTNVGATNEPGEPGHGENRGGSSVWYKYAAPGTGVLHINTGGGDLNSTLAVYTGTSMSNLVLLAENDDLAENNAFSIFSRVKTGVLSGTTYYIAVDGKNYGNGADAGNFQLNYTLQNAVTNDSFATPTNIYFETNRMHTDSNVGASKELGEPNHAGNAGGKSLWFKWVSTATMSKSMTFELRSMSMDSSPIGVFSLLAVYTGSTLDSLVTVKSSARQGLNKVTFTAVPNTTYYIAVDGWDSGSGAATGTFDLSYRPTKSPKQADFDRDGKADLAVFRPTTGVWYSFESSVEEMRGYQFGATGDKPLIGNDGVNDGAIDYTIYRPDTGVWYISRSTGSFSIFAFGVATDIPMVRYSENQLSQTATVFRPQDGTWWTRAQNGTFSVVQWGAMGDIPLLADFTGDGTDEITVFRPSTGTWYIFKSGTYSVIQFGQEGDKPVPADYDGDGRSDPAIFRPSTNTWWILRSTDNAQVATQFGAATDKLQPADYDGDGKDDIAVYRNGVWWILDSSTGNTRAVPFGLSSDIALSSPMP